MKTLKIKPDGHLIKGGQIAYNFDANGTIDFSIDVTAHYLFSDHQITQTGTYHVSPELLQSAKVFPKEKFTMGKVTMEIKKVIAHRATAEVKIEGVGQGTAFISLKNQLIEIEALAAVGFVYGQPVSLATV